jgi:hypothetical protein
VEVDRGRYRDRTGARAERGRGRRAAALAADGLRVLAVATP